MEAFQAYRFCYPIGQLNVGFEVPRRYGEVTLLRLPPPRLSRNVLRPLEIPTTDSLRGPIIWLVLPQAIRSWLQSKQPSSERMFTRLPLDSIDAFYSTFIMRWESCDCVSRLWQLAHNNLHFDISRSMTSIWRPSVAIWLISHSLLSLER